MSALPSLGRGRPTEARRAAYEVELAAFCDLILKIPSRVDFQVGTRDWCYLLEGEGVCTKGDFSDVEDLIACCRKDGDLPLDICAEDTKRAAEGHQFLNGADIETEAESIIDYVHHAHHSYTPISFWDNLEYYVELAVEKSDLKSLFARITREFHIVSQNVGGWCDLNCRAGMMRRFQQWEAKGKRCILLYCGDHDPGGLQISEFLRANLKELERAVGWSPDNLVIDRFGLDYDFIEANGLTWIDNLETGSGKSLDDPKHPDHKKPYVQSYLRRFGARKVEANALVARPGAGRELCRQAVLRYVPEDALVNYEEQLRSVRQKLRDEINRQLLQAAP